MENRKKPIILAAVAVVLLALVAGWLWRGDVADKDMASLTGTDPQLEEDPESEWFPTIVVPKAVGWPEGAAPISAEGLEVSRFAAGLDHPRNMLSLPNGDVIVALAKAPAGNGPGGITGLIAKWLMGRAGATGTSPDQLVLLRDANGDGAAEARFVLREGLSSPSGIGYRDGKLYVAQHDALLAFAFEPGQTKLAGEPEKLMDLPPGGNHWVRNLAIDIDGKLYVAVGSASNIGEGGMDAEQGRAAIWQYDTVRKIRRQFAAGLRNPNGLDFNPATRELWTTVNERDMLGSDMVPDYLTNVPVGAQYGWPWVYWKDVMDHRVKDPMPQFLTEYTRKPEYALGPHVAALGLAFTGAGHRMGAAFENGAFIARHGSWNRRPVSGYDVIFVPFDELGNPSGMPRPVLSGFLNSEGDAQGRPSGVAWDKTGALLVSDDTAGIIWRVEAPGAKPATPPREVRSTPLPPRRELKGGAIATFKPDPDGGQ